MTCFIFVVVYHLDVPLNIRLLVPENYKMPGCFACCGGKKRREEPYRSSGPSGSRAASRPQCMYMNLYFLYFSFITDDFHLFAIRISICRETRMRLSVFLCFFVCCCGPSSVQEKIRIEVCNFNFF